LKPLTTVGIEPLECITWDLREKRGGVGPPKLFN